MSNILGDSQPNPIQSSENETTKLDWDEIGNVKRSGTYISNQQNKVESHPKEKIATTMNTTTAAGTHSYKRSERKAKESEAPELNGTRKQRDKHWKQNTTTYE